MYVFQITLKYGKPLVNSTAKLDKDQSNEKILAANSRVRGFTRYYDKTIYRRYKLPTDHTCFIFGGFLVHHLNWRWVTSKGYLPWQLSCHAQRHVAICLLEIELEVDEISIKFKLLWIIVSSIRPISGRSFMNLPRYLINFLDFIFLWMETTYPILRHNLYLKLDDNPTPTHPTPTPLSITQVIQVIKYNSLEWFWKLLQ